MKLILLLNIIYFLFPLVSLKTFFTYGNSHSELKNSPLSYLICSQFLGGGGRGEAYPNNPLPPKLMPGMSQLKAKVPFLLQVG